MPSVAADIDVVGVAIACGYPNAVSVDSFELQDRALDNQNPEYGANTI